MKLLLGNPGGGFANAWWCTGPPCPFDTRDPFNASHNVPLLSAESVLLFNVSHDPGEHNNLAPQQPEIVASLRAKIEQYNRTAVSSAQQGLADDERGNPKTRTDGHQGTVFPWVV
jgi:hypothetical protein